MQKLKESSRLSLSSRGCCGCAWWLVLEGERDRENEMGKVCSSTSLHITRASFFNSFDVVYTSFHPRLATSRYSFFLAPLFLALLMHKLEIYARVTSILLLHADGYFPLTVSMQYQIWCAFHFGDFVLWIWIPFFSHCMHCSRHWNHDKTSLTISVLVLLWSSLARLFTSSVLPCVHLLVCGGRSLICSAATLASLLTDWLTDVRLTDMMGCHFGNGQAAAAAAEKEHKWRSANLVSIRAVCSMKAKERYISMTLSVGNRRGFLRSVYPATTKDAG